MSEGINFFVNAFRSFVIINNWAILFIRALWGHLRGIVFDLVQCPLLIVLDQTCLDHDLLDFLVDNFLLLRDNLPTLVHLDPIGALFNVNLPELLGLGDTEKRTGRLVLQSSTISVLLWEAPEVRADGLLRIIVVPKRVNNLFVHVASAHALPTAVPMSQHRLAQRLHSETF